MVAEYESGGHEHPHGSEDHGEHVHESNFWNRLMESNGSGPLMRWVAFSMFVMILILALLSFQVEQRNDVIEETRAAAERIEEAATHTEEVLVEIQEERESPEALARNEAVQEALREISQIRAAICSLPEIVDSPECNGGADDAG